MEPPTKKELGFAKRIKMRRMMSHKDSTKLKVGCTMVLGLDKKGI